MARSDELASQCADFSVGIRKKGLKDKLRGIRSGGEKTLLLHSRRFF
jgi:hypothetical protein